RAGRRRRPPSPRPARPRSRYAGTRPRPAWSRPRRPRPAPRSRWARWRTRRPPSRRRAGRRRRSPPARRGGSRPGRGRNPGRPPPRPGRAPGPAPAATPAAPRPGPRPTARRPAAPASRTARGRADGDRIRDPAERRRQRGLVPRPYGQQGGDRAEQAWQPGAGGEQRAGPVLAGQPERERLLAGRPGGPVALRLALRLAERPYPRLGGVVRGDRGFVPLVQPELALVERADLGLQRRELGVRGRGPIPCLGRRRGDPVDLLRLGAEPGPHRLDLAAEPGQPLPPVGHRADRGDQRPLGRGQRPLQLLPLGDGLGQPAAVVLERVPQPLLLV